MSLLIEPLSELFFEYGGKHEAFLRVPVLRNLFPVSVSFEIELKRFHPDMKYADEMWVNEVIKDLKKHDITCPINRVMWYSFYYDSRIKAFCASLNPEAEEYKIIPRFLLGDFSGLHAKGKYPMKQLILFGIYYCPEIAIRISLLYVSMLPEELFINGFIFNIQLFSLRNHLGKSFWSVDDENTKFVETVIIFMSIYIEENIALFKEGREEDLIQGCICFLTTQDLFKDYIPLPLGCDDDIDGILDKVVKNDYYSHKISKKRCLVS